MTANDHDDDTDGGGGGGDSSQQMRILRQLPGRSLTCYFTAKISVSQSNSDCCCSPWCSNRCLAVRLVANFAADS